MDSLHTVLRSIRSETKGETKSRRDHISVFREFLDHLDHLDRAARRREKSVKPPKSKSQRGKR